MAESGPWYGVFVRRPLGTLGVLGVLTVVAGLGALRLTFDPSPERMFPQGHEAVERFEAFREAFGGDESLVVVVEVDPAVGSPLDRERVGAVRALARDLEGLEGVDHAVSVGDVRLLRVDPLTRVPALFPAFPEDLGELEEGAWEARVEHLLHTPFVDRLLVSADREATAVVAVLEGREGRGLDAVETEALVRGVEARCAELEEAQEGVRCRIGGSPVIKAEIVGAINRDMAVFAGPLILIAVVAVGVLLGSARAVAVVLWILGTTVVVVMGVTGWLGIPLDSFTALIPPLILVIGVADALHLLVKHQHRVGREGDSPEALVRSLGDVLLPCALTSLTTAMGFGSLLTSDIEPLRWFGVVAAVASVVAFVVTVTAAPALVAWWGLPARARPSVRTEGLAGWVTRGPVLGLALGVALAGWGGFGVASLRVDTDYLSFFPDGSRLVRDTAAIQERFVGLAPLEVLVEAPAGALREPAALNALYRFERALEQEDEVDLCVSVADGVALAQEARGRPRGIPERAEGIAEIEALVRVWAQDTQPLERLVQRSASGGEWARVSVRAHMMGSTQLQGVLARLDALAEEHLEPVGLSAEATGTAVVFAQASNQIYTGQVESFAWAFGVITLTVMVAFGSLRLGLLSILPNLAPILAILGAMAALKIPLNSFNSMVCSVAIGIAVDDTIHLLSGYRKARERSRPLAAIRETIAHEGAPILATSAVLSAGFAVLLLGSFSPTREFGMLVAVSIGAALVGDLVILPAILSVLPQSPPFGGEAEGA